MTHIGITGSYGGLNAGDEAILGAMLGSLRRRLPGATVTVFSRNARHTRSTHAVDCAVPIRRLTREQARREVARLDLLLVGGGGILYDTESRYYLREALLAQQRGVPTMAYAVGAGPLSHPADRQLVRRALGAMDAVTVRDPGAKRILEDAGVARRVELTADPALLLEPVPFDPGRLRAQGIPEGRPLVGLSLRERGPAAPSLGGRDYPRALARAADHMAERLDAEVLLIPMERCDIQLARAVLARMGHAERGHLLLGRHKPAELLGLMPHLDMVVAMRLHVLIFAAMAGTPPLALAYAPKVGDFADWIGLPATTAMSEDRSDELVAAVDAVWQHREEHAVRLQRAVDTLRARSARTVDIALGCLEPALPLAA